MLRSRHLRLPNRVATRTIIFCFNPIRRKPTHHGKVGVVVGTTQRIGFFFNRWTKKTANKGLIFRDDISEKKKTYDYVLTKGGGGKDWRVQHGVLERL